MAIKLDEEARAAVTRRRARGRSDAILLGIELIPGRGVVRVLKAAWVSPSRVRPGLDERRVGDVVVYVSPGVARYTTWHDLTISGWHLGPFERLTIVDEPLVLLALQEWERLHPAWQPRAAA
jgi:hypothetical protein